MKEERLARERAFLELASQKGYLVSRGRQDQRTKLESSWRRECLRGQRPLVHAWIGYAYRPRVLVGSVYVELSGAWWLSRRLWNAILQGLPPELEPTRLGNRIHISWIPHRELEQTAEVVLDLLHRHRPELDEAFDLPSRLVRGHARCISAYGMAHVMTEGQSYYIREIPNMKGHVVALRGGEHALVGVHLERFELVEGSESLREHV